MTDEERLEAVLTAVTAALVDVHGETILDLEKLAEGVADAGIPATATTVRGSLVAELSFIREERRTMAARRDNAEGYDRQELDDIVKRIDAREEEIQALLWK